MKHPFKSLRSEYEVLLGTMQITRSGLVTQAAHRLLLNENMSRYRAVGAKLGIPPALIAALDLRESDANARAALGQGDRWHLVSVHEPKGFGPFPSWEAAAEFYLRREQFDQTTAPWDMPYVCWKAEGWNGFGPRDHGINSGYLWASTNHYTRGKYVADGIWSPSTVDVQLGAIPVIVTLMQLEPTLVIPGMPSVHVDADASKPMPVPEGLSSAAWVQKALNTLGQNPPLLVDGSYGRMTRAAVRTFQAAHNLEADGLAGPLTLAAMRAAL